MDVPLHPGPPCQERGPNLSWNHVVEYAFLADFDLLQDSCHDVHERPWTKPACHVVIDHYFKLKHACEEIQHLNVEICHIVTYIWDEDEFLHLKEAEIMLNSGLACQVKIHRMEQGCFNVLIWHIQYLSTESSHQYNIMVKSTKIL
jgi:hypothetical protein